MKIIWRLSACAPICLSFSVLKYCYSSINTKIDKIKHLSVLNKSIKALMPFTLLPVVFVHLWASYIIIVISMMSTNTPKIFPTWEMPNWITKSFKIYLIFIWNQIASNCRVYQSSFSKDVVGYLKLSVDLYMCLYCMLV